MKKIFLNLSILLSAAFAEAQTVPNVTAAELALHRIEKLVILRKVDAKYQSNFRHLTIEKLTPARPTDPSFKVVAFQSPGTDNLADMVEITLDKKGKALSHRAMVHTESPKLITWPQKNAVTLSELALHYLEDNYQSNDGSKETFVASVNNLTVSQVSDQAGNTDALITMKNSIDQRSLVFRYTLDGRFISSEVKP